MKGLKHLGAAVFNRAKDLLKQVDLAADKLAVKIEPKEKTEA